MNTFWSLKAKQEKCLRSLLSKLGESLQRSLRLQEVIGALEGKEGEECEEYDDCKKMEDASIETKIDDVDYTPSVMLLTLFFIKFFMLLCNQRQLALVLILYICN